jgi:hypothetical protein
MVKSVPEECWRRFLPRIPRKEILAGAQNPELVLVGEPVSGAEAFARGGASKNPGSGPRVGERTLGSVRGGRRTLGPVRVWGLENPGFGSRGG